MASRFHLRLATVEDVPALAAAERICFSDPWSEAGVRSLFQSDTSFGVMATPNRSPKEVAGYLFARAIGQDAEILNLAVQPSYRRQGLGRTLLVDGLERLAARGAVRVFLEVRESNESARRLYAGQGFRVLGMRPDYYRDPREHALILEWQLSS